MVHQVEWEDCLIHQNTGRKGKELKAFLEPDSVNNYIIMHKHLARSWVQGPAPYLWVLQYTCDEVGDYLVSFSFFPISPIQQ